MKKVLKGLISLVFAVMVLVPMSAFAATDVATYDELKSAVSNGGDIKLNADVTVKDTSSAKSGTIKNTVETAETFNLIKVGNNTTEGKLTVDSGNIEGIGGRQTIYIIKGNTIVNGGVIKNSVDERTAILVDDYTSLVVNGGEMISTKGYAITAWKDATVTVNNGTIKGRASALSGNGLDSASGAKFDIKGGTFTSEEDVAIYLPQIDGETKITGGTFNGASGVEIRAGKLEISGGTFTATADSLVVDDNGM